MSYDAGQGQSGDHTSRDHAGRDISVNDPEAWLRYLWDVDQARTRRDDELRHEIGAARAALASLAEQSSLYQHLLANRLTADAQRAAVTRRIAILALALALVALALSGLACGAALL